MCREEQTNPQHVQKSLHLYKSKAKQSNGSKVMQRRAMLSKATQCTVMQNRCLKTGMAWFWLTRVLVYLYFLVVHMRELNLLRALSWMAGEFDSWGKAYCLPLVVWNAAFCECWLKLCFTIFPSCSSASFRHIVQKRCPACSGRLLMIIFAGLNCQRTHLLQTKLSMAGWRNSFKILN